MKVEHERKIMDFLIQSTLESNFVCHVRAISTFTDISRSSLQRILPRLEKRGWIEKNESMKIIGYIPVERVDDAYFSSYKNKDGKKINIVLSYKSEQKYNSELEKLVRKQIYVDFEGRISLKNEIYSEVFEKTDKRKKNAMKRKMGFRFPGRSKLLRRYLKNELPKQITYYKIIKYPYLIFINNKLRLDLKSNFSVPYGKKRFWKQSAKKIKQKYGLYELILNNNR